MGRPETMVDQKLDFDVIDAVVVEDVFHFLQRGLVQCGLQVAVPDSHSFEPRRETVSTRWRNECGLASSSASGRVPENVQYDATKSFLLFMGYLAMILTRCDRVESP